MGRLFRKDNTLPSPPSGAFALSRSFCQLQKPGKSQFPLAPAGLGTRRGRIQERLLSAQPDTAYQLINSISPAGQTDSCSDSSQPCVPMNSCSCFPRRHQPLRHCKVAEGHTCFLLSRGCKGILTKCAISQSTGAVYNHI